MTPEPLPSDDALALLAHRARQALPDAPPALLHAAIGLWQAAPIVPLVAPLAAALRRVAAVLRFDSWALPPQALGMRGVAADNRHLLFSAEGRDVDLRITREPGGSWSLAGQVLGPDETGHIVLQPAEGGGGSGTGHRTHLDPLGEFRLDGVAPGQWCLSLETADQIVALPAIDVGGARPA
jgi:hypothetical protein